MADYPGNPFSDEMTSSTKLLALEKEGLLIEIPEGQAGGGGGPADVNYSMRAYRALTPGYVHWTSTNSPDYAGTGSGYNPAELTDITVVSYG